MNDYLLHINSFEWKQKKKELISIFGNKCEACGDSGSVQCHHGCYAKLGNEPLHHIFLLCDSCHKEYHKSPIGLSIEETERFIGKKRGIEKYWNYRRKILKSFGIISPKTNY